MEDIERNGETMADFSAQVIAESGLGFGTGTISVEKRLQSDAEHPLDGLTLQIVDAAIESPEILVPIDTDDNGAEIDDDGCGDGRGVKIVMQGTEIKKRSLNRKKVFGGGLTMGVASRIGMGKASGPLEHEFEAAISDFSGKELSFGGHTDDHAQGENCGCGAIDKAPQIVASALIFRDGIENAVELLTGVPTADNAALAKVFDNYKAYADTLIGQNYSGATVMKKIIDSGKIVKQLEGPHLEVRTVLNTVKGYTINQAHIRGVSEGKAQVFGVDEWRIRELAETFYATPEEQNESYVSMLVYTLATAGVLTGGDQKVYAIANNPQLANA